MIDFDATLADMLTGIDWQPRRPPTQLARYRDLYQALKHEFTNNDPAAMSAAS